MSEQEFINEMITMGYRMDGKFTLQKIGPENVYVFFVYPAKQDKFNWGKCTTDFLKNAVQAGNALGHIGMMDFTNLKSIEKCGDKLKVYTTGLTKACAAFVFINKKLPYNI